MKHLCTTCWRWKGLHNFRRDRARLGGYASRSKTCDQTARIHQNRKNAVKRRNHRRDVQTAFAIVEER